MGPGVLTGVVTDARGRIRFESTDLPQIPFSADASTVRSACDVIRLVSRQAGVDWNTVKSVGLALHDVVTSRGEWTVWSQPGIPPLPVRSILERELDRIATVEDVSRAYAKTEHEFGGGHEVPDMMYVFIGKRNAGAGIFVNGRMLRSASGVCGEIGHIIVREDGPLCQCGNRGCFEAVSSGDALLQRYKSLSASGVPTSDLSDSTAFAVMCEAYALGEKAAQLVLHELAMNLGRALASAISVSGATSILIGGNLRLAGPRLLSDVEINVRQRVIPALAPHIRVDFARSGGHGGAWGAALVSLDEAWSAGRFYADAIADR